LAISKWMRVSHLWQSIQGNKWCKILVWRDTIPIANQLNYTLYLPTQHSFFHLRVITPFTSDTITTTTTPFNGFFLRKTWVSRSTKGAVHKLYNSKIVFFWTTHPPYVTLRNISVTHPPMLYNKMKQRPPQKNDRTRNWHTKQPQSLSWFRYIRQVSSMWMWNFTHSSTFRRSHAHKLMKNRCWVTSKITRSHGSARVL